MRRALPRVLALAAFAAAVAGGVLLWRVRPWRTLVSVNGSVLTEERASACADALWGAASRASMDPAARLRRVAGIWTLKEALLQEAVSRACRVTAAEAEIARAAAVTNRLRGFRLEEALLVSELVRREAVETAFAEGVPASKDGADAETRLRAGAQERLAGLVRRIYGKTAVRSDAYPELERAEGACAYTADDCRFLWLLWDLRPVAAVGGRTLSAHELDLRARTLLNEARSAERKTVVSPAREAELLRHYRRKAAQMWIVREVLLAEARTRGLEAEAASNVLKLQGGAHERHFKIGPLPEEVKRRDFEESRLIDRLADAEVQGRIRVTRAEVETRLAELRRLASAQTGRDGKSKSEPTRRNAEELLRAERYRKEFRAYFCALFARTRVRCPGIPEFETVDGVLLPRSGDGATKEKEGGT